MSLKKSALFGQTAAVLNSYAAGRCNPVSVRFISKQQSLDRVLPQEDDTETMVPIVAFIGWHDSGKTTLAVRVVKYLKEHGYMVAVIKSSKETGITFDHIDTDTARYRTAGADAVTFIAPDQMVIMTAAPAMSLVNLVQRFFSHVDIVIAEGFKDEPHIAKIEVTKAADDLLRDRVNGVIALATDRTMNGDNVFRLEQSREIADFIEKRFLGSSADRNEPASGAKTAHVTSGDSLQEQPAGLVTGSSQTQEPEPDIKTKPTLCRLQKTEEYYNQSG